MKEPTKAQRIFCFLVTCFCLVMFLLPVCAIIVHCAAVNETERRWKERERKEQKKTKKSFEAYKKALEKASDNECPDAGGAE